MLGKCILSRNTPGGHKLTCTTLYLEEYGLLRCDTMLSGRNIPTIMKGPTVPHVQRKRMENMDMGTHGPEETMNMNVAVLREKVKQELLITKVHPRTGHEG